MDYGHKRESIDCLVPYKFSVNNTQFIVCCAYTNKLYWVLAENTKIALQAVLDFLGYSRYSISQANGIANYVVTHYVFEEENNVRNQNVKVKSQRYYVTTY